MRNLFFITLVILLLPLTSLAKGNWSGAIVTNLPKPLSKIKLKKTTQSDVKKMLGKPAKVKGNRHSYKIKKYGLDFSLDILYGKNAVKELSYTFRGAKPSFDQTKVPIDIQNMSMFPDKGNDAGKYFKYKDDEGEVIIDPISKSIQSLKLN